MKVAIVHDWLTGMRGGENCLEVFCELFPNATLFTLLHNKGSVSNTIEKMDIKTSFIQNMPFSSTKYRNYLPFFPQAIEAFDLSEYDLVLSSSHCVAKGVRVPKKALHICYCYTPMRYAWSSFNDYFGDRSLLQKKIISVIIERLKKWDISKNEMVDFFVAISDNVSNRINKYYKRGADVICPPVDIDRYHLSEKSEDFYLIVSALVPYKRVDIAIKAFNKLKKELVIIGTGNIEADLKKMAGDNIRFLGWLSNDAIADYYSRCKALIFPGEEDFGIVPLEAQACGKPVIAYGAGGVLETIVPANTQSGLSTELEPTGVFFYEQTEESLFTAIDYFEENLNKFNTKEIRENAIHFDRSIFKKKIKEYIEEKIEARV